jgi:hypothetical protein
MKRIALIILSALFLLSLVTSPSHAKSSHRVKGYTKKNGTYIAPHRKTNPDKSKMNNYDAKGNYNPYTGKEGTKDPFKK